MNQPHLFDECHAHKDRGLVDVLAPRCCGHRSAQAAASKAESVAPGWTAYALALVESFAREATAPWLIEDARAYAESKGLPSPPDKRAWGHIATSLRRRGLIVSVGFASARSSNGSPKVQWRAR